MRRIFLLSRLAAAVLLTAGIAQAQYGTSSQQPANSAGTASQQTSNSPSAAPQQPRGTTGGDYSATPTATPNQGGSNEIRLAGCLRQGSTAGEYALVGGGANIYELKSGGIALGSHIEQMVEIAGVKNNDGTITVTGLNMVSTTCTSY